MLKATAYKFRDITIVRCQGRIVVGECFGILRDAALAHNSAGTLVLDLAHVDCIDAGGLGVLLGLREWAHANATRFKLMNAVNNVDRVIKLTRLDRVFEFWSVRDMFRLVRLADMPLAVDHWGFRACGEAALRELPAA
jgi:anti-anti-sigma factor